MTRIPSKLVTLLMVLFFTACTQKGKTIDVHKAESSKQPTALRATAEANDDLESFLGIFSGQSSMPMTEVFSIAEILRIQENKRSPRSLTSM